MPEHEHVSVGFDFAIGLHEAYGATSLESAHSIYPVNVRPDAWQSREQPTQLLTNPSSLTLALIVIGTVTATRWIKSFGRFGAEQTAARRAVDGHARRRAA